MECKLCLLDKTLIKAHIIPDFIYSNIGLYEPDKKGQGRLHVGKIKNGHFSYNPKGTTTGEYDKQILCKECDGQILGSYEDYGKKVLFDGLSKIKEFQFKKDNDQSLNRDIQTFENIDYTRFKLFLLSIFWKGSISNRDFSSEINLGTEKNEVLRQMLLDKDPKNSDDFSIIFWYIDMIGFPSGLITNFKKFSPPSKPIFYALLIGNILIALFPQQNSIPDTFKPNVFSPNGILKIVALPKEVTETVIGSFIG